MTEHLQPASSWVASIYYDDENQVLQITTKQGRTITKIDVPPDVWEELKQAPSIGQAINAHILGSYENG